MERAGRILRFLISRFGAGTSFEISQKKGLWPAGLGVWRIAAVVLAATAFILTMLTIDWFGSKPMMAASPVQIHLDHWSNGGSPQTEKKWRDGNLHWTNSHYAEGDADPTRFIMDNLQPNTTYTLQFSWLATKVQAKVVKHAHDFLTSYTFSEFPSYVPNPNVLPSYTGATDSYPGNTTPYPDPCLPRVQGGYKLPYACTPLSAPTSLWPIPSDNILGAQNNKVNLGGRQIDCATGTCQYLSMWNATINGVAASSDNGYVYSPSNNPFSGTSYNSLTLSFTTSNFLVGTTDSIVLAFGGHLATAATWGSGQGSADINGAPYHWEYVIVDQNGVKVASGARDRSIMVVRKGSIEIQKKCSPDDGGQGFLFTTSQPSGVDGLPASFSLDCNTQQGATIDGGSGTYSITEKPLPGFAVTSISCTRYGADGSNLGPPSGMSIVPSLSVAYPNSVTLSFYFVAGDNTVCTFINSKPNLTINLTPPTKTNEVGQPHTITATVLQDKADGLGLVPAPGAVVNFTVPSNPPGAVFVGGVNSCTTNASGQCPLTIIANNTGTVQIHATTTYSVIGVGLTRSTGDGLLGDGSDVYKIYVDGYIKIYPTAVNEVRNSHTFTIEAHQIPDGAAAATSANITYAVTPTPSSISSSDCGTSVPFVGSVATCHVTINSDTAGVFTANATAVFTIDTVTLTRSTDSTHGSSGPATKTYVDANIVLTPPTATNDLSQPHTITATVKQNDGTGGFVPAVSKPVTFSFASNPNNATFVNNVNTCTTDQNGQCPVTIVSSQPGTDVIHATTTFSVLGVNLTRATSDGLPGDGSDVNKIYVEHPSIAITKICDGNVSPGQLITFRGTITNGGNVPLVNIQFTDTLPPGASNLTITQAAATTLAVGAQTTYAGSYLPNPTVAGPQYNKAAVTAQSQYTNTTVSNSTSDQGCGIIFSPALTVSKLCTPPKVGYVIAFNGTISNSGDEPLSNIKVYDNQPAANTLVTTIASLAVGASVPYTGSYTLTSSGPSSDQITVVATGAIDKASVTNSSNVATCTVPPQACSVTQGGWFAGSNGGNYGALLQTWFPTVYPSGLQVGGSGATNNWNIRFPGSATVSYSQPGGNTAGVLRRNWTVSTTVENPSAGITEYPFNSGNDTGTGNFGSQVTALKINVDLGAAGAFASHPGIGGLKLYGTGSSLDGLTVSQILAVAQQALAGGAFPAGFDANSFAGFLGNYLNPSFDQCKPSGWALGHLQ